VSFYVTAVSIAYVVVVEDLVEGGTLKVLGVEAVSHPIQGIVQESVLKIRVKGLTKKRNDPRGAVTLFMRSGLLSFIPTAMIRETILAYAKVIWIA
jgi:hypothetical protein